jgi:hypothetical protein
MRHEQAVACSRSEQILNRDRFASAGKPMQQLDLGNEIGLSKSELGYRKRGPTKFHREAVDHMHDPARHHIV